MKSLAIAFIETTGLIAFWAALLFFGSFVA